VGTSPADTSGIMLPADVQAAADQEAAQIAPVPSSPAPTPVPLPGGVSAFPVDFCTNLQCQILPVGGAVAAALPASVTVMVAGKILNSDGSITNCQWPNTFAPSAGLYFNSDLAPGYLLSMAVTLQTPGIPSGALFCVLGLCHQNAPPQPLDAVLISGYVTSSNPLGWPSGVLHDVGDGPGCPVYVYPPNPGAGNLVAYVVSDLYLQPTAVTFTLSTSGTVTSRTPWVFYGYGGVAYWSLGIASILQPASTVVVYEFSLGSGTMPSALNVFYVGPIATGVRMVSGMTLYINAQQFQPGDAFSGISIQGNAWT